MEQVTPLWKGDFISDEDQKEPGYLKKRNQTPMNTGPSMGTE
jgi:hypothetical protein